MSSAPLSGAAEHGCTWVSPGATSLPSEYALKKHTTCCGIRLTPLNHPDANLQRLGVSNAFFSSDSAGKEDLYADRTIGPNTRQTPKACTEARVSPVPIALVTSAFTQRRFETPLALLLEYQLHFYERPSCHLEALGCSSAFPPVHPMATVGGSWFPSLL